MVYKKHNFEWWSDKIESLSDDERDFLEKEALDRISEMVKQGYVAGELVSTLIQDGIEYDITGWWAV